MGIFSLMSRVLRHTFRIIAIIVLVTGVMFTFVLAFVVSGFDGDANFPADCAIVFGAAVHPVFDVKGRVVSNTAGPGIYRRVKTAVDLYKNKDVRRLFMSGGKGDPSKISEAVVMRDLALQMGVDPADIVTETESRSTKENIRLTKPLAATCTSVVGISDRYHLARIAYLAEREDWELSTYPAQRLPDRIFESKSVFREVVALIILHMPFYSR